MALVLTGPFWHELFEGRRPVYARRGLLYMHQQAMYVISSKHCLQELRFACGLMWILALMVLLTQMHPLVCDHWL